MTYTFQIFKLNLRENVLIICKRAEKIVNFLNLKEFI